VGPFRCAEVATMSTRIRIVSHENVVTNAKILYLPDEGSLFGADGEPVSEVDISNCVTAVDVHLHVGEISRATLHVLLVDADVTTDAQEIVRTRLKPRSRFRRLQRLRWRLVHKLKTWVARSLSQEVRQELAAHHRRQRSHV
jgi:hypothetical protein